MSQDVSSGPDSLSTFQARLDRIENGTQVRPDGVIVGRRGPSRKALKRRRLRLSVLWSVCALFLCGMVTVALSRYWRFQYFGIELASFTDASGVAIDMTAAGLSIFVQAIATKLNTPFYLGAHVAGTTASFFGMHMAVHRFPDFFAETFSMRWLYMVLTSTDPNRFMITIDLGG
jgi:hypothetical protein